MKLKSYFAPTLKEAFQLIRNELGDDAIIVESKKTPRGVEVVIKLPMGHSPLLQKENIVSVPQLQNIEPHLETHLHNQATQDQPTLTTNTPTLTSPETLASIGFPDDFIQQWKNWITSGKSVDLSQLVPCFPNWVDQLSPKKPIFFIGPVGAGKTSSLAKLAAVLKSGNIPVRGISCDVTKAGSKDQIRSYFHALDCTLDFANSPNDLIYLALSKDSSCITLIDTPAIHPYASQGMQSLAEYILPIIKQVSCEVCIVVSCLMDLKLAEEIIEGLKIFQPTTLLFTGADLTKRYAPLLYLPLKTQIPIGCYGASRSIGDGLYPTSPEILSSLLTPPLMKKVG